VSSTNRAHTENKSAELESALLAGRRMNSPKFARDFQRISQATFAVAFFTENRNILPGKSKSESRTAVLSDSG
jgi:hypothetical protein